METYFISAVHYTICAFIGLLRYRETSLQNMVKVSVLSDVFVCTTSTSSFGTFCFFSYANSAPSCSPNHVLFAYALRLEFFVRFLVRFPYVFWYVFHFWSCTYTRLSYRTPKEPILLNFSASEKEVNKTVTGHLHATHKRRSGRAVPRSISPYSAASLIFSRTETEHVRRRSEWISMIRWYCSATTVTYGCVRAHGSLDGTHDG